MRIISDHLAADCNIESSICEHVVYEMDRLLARYHLAEFVEATVVCCTQIDEDSCSF